MAKKSKVELILDTIKDTTRDWDKDNYTVEDKQSEKAKKASKALSAMTISAADKDRFAEVVSVVLGEKVLVEKDEELDLSGALIAVVVTKAGTDKFKHGYETDKIVITTGDGFGLGSDNKVGNLLPPKREFVRPATDEEIEAIPEAQVKALQKEANIVIVG